ncbi:MAG: S24 family peptidase [Patescibacteria group bacterium]
MHTIQEKLLKLTEGHDLANMSLREIGKLINETSPQKIKHHLLQLEKNGLLQMDRLAKVMVKTRPGALQRNSLLAIPILGTANCGPATAYADQEAQGYLRVSGKLLSKKKGIFAIKASGHSMNKANINGECVEDGDYALVDPTNTVVKNGDYVLSIIDGMANIKRYFRDTENERIILLSESSASVSPIFIHRDDMDNYLVNGKVIQVIKKPKTAWSKFKKFVYRDTPNYQ